MQLSTFMLCSFKLDYLNDKTDMLLIPVDSAFTRRSAVSIMHQLKLRRKFEHATLTFAVYAQQKLSLFHVLDSFLHDSGL
jgi:hypothetical protein